MPDALWPVSERVLAQLDPKYKARAVGGGANARVTQPLAWDSAALRDEVRRNYEAMPQFYPSTE